MVSIDLLLHGVPARTSHGYLSFSSSSLVDRRIVVDTGSLARRPLLETTLEDGGVSPADVEHVLLTHLHYDHCDNVDLFPNATVHLYEPELRRVERGEYDWATPRNAAAIFEDVDLELFEAGDRIEGLTAVHTPGHCKEHVSFTLEVDGLTVGLAGDAVKNMRETATREPMVLSDKGEAIETLDEMCDLLDFVVPGHETPFYIDEDSMPVPTIDTDLGIRLQTTTHTATTTTIETDRSECRPLPDFVTDVSARQ